MNSNSKNLRARITIVAIIVLIAGLACLCLPGSIVPTTPTPQITLPTPQLPPSDTQSPTINPGGLNAVAPWLLMETDQGLWAANPDGSGLAQLTHIDYWNGNLPEAVQPSGNQIVFLSPGGYDFHHMALNLLSLPDGHITKITDLTSAQSEAYAGSGPGDPGFEALRAVGERSSYAWSPDGTRLAFVGIMDGPSAEIYLYDVTSGTIRRVSQEDAQDFSPSWSPDGNHLLYLGAKGFGTGAGMVMAGVWAADGTGGNATLLYPSSSSGEEIVGWLDNTTAILDTWSVVCGSAQLRLYDVVSKQASMLNQECFIAAAANPRRGEAFFANSNGLYLLTAGNRKPTLVSQDIVGMIYPWRGDKNDLITVGFHNGGIATFGSGTIDHQVSPVNAPAENLDVAEYGAIWGWTSKDDSQPGAWITGPGVDIGQIFKGKARLPIWDSHNNLLFFAPKDGGGYSIYRATFDTHYADLSVVASINAEVQMVTWLGVH
jgi:hypothetical protein